MPVLSKCVFLHNFSPAETHLMIIYCQLLLNEGCSMVSSWFAITTRKAICQMSQFFNLANRAAIAQWIDHHARGFIIRYAALVRRRAGNTAVNSEEQNRIISLFYYRYVYRQCVTNWNRTSHSPFPNCICHSSVSGNTLARIENIETTEIQLIFTHDFLFLHCFLFQAAENQAEMRNE